MRGALVCGGLVDTSLSSLWHRGGKAEAAGGSGRGGNRAGAGGGGAATENSSGVIAGNTTLVPLGCEINVPDAAITVVINCALLSAAAMINSSSQSTCGTGRDGAGRGGRWRSWWWGETAGNDPNENSHE